jgi:phosphoglycerate dehydrogenase-like enzyme
MLRCAILDDYQGVARRYGDFSRLDARVETTIFRENIADTETLLATLAPFDIVVAMRERTPLGADRLSRLPNLKLLVTTGMKNAAIDVAAAKARGITVCGTPGFVGSTAELAWGLLLGLMRHIPEEVQAFRAGDAAWQRHVGRDLNGLTLAVLGLGNLGAKIAAFGKAFQMEVHGWSRNNTPERSAALGIHYAPDLDALLARADVVSINLTLTGETRGLIDARRLGLMKKGAVLVNTSRGPIVDETALIAALTSGHLGGAGLDVFDTEPLPADHPFRTLPNVIATPHVGYVTDNSYRAFFTGIVENIEGWLAGNTPRILT